MPVLSNDNATGTQTQVESVDPLPRPGSVLSTVTLRLRGVPAERRRIRWAADVIDNEGLGRKSSKMCCIYHKPREVGESSDEDSDSSSSSDSKDVSDGDGADDGRARMGGNGKRKDNGRQRGHGEEGCRGGHDRAGGSWKGKERARRTARNAYEETPRNGGTSDMKK
ncbi:hypothetical protein MMC07_004362 [Pseudocyphellaria aurata]|nr:hypothetical protein [Pseudocyphellaria aurata]